MGYGLLATGATPAANWNPVASVPADGSSAVAVVFDTAFGGGVPTVCVTVSDPSAWDGYQLDTRAINVTASGFSVLVSGGPNGSTVNVGYIALGSA